MLPVLSLAGDAVAFFSGRGLGVDFGLAGEGLGRGVVLFFGVGLGLGLAFGLGVLFLVGVAVGLGV